MNEQVVYNCLSSKGLPPHAVAGIMGNLAAESGLNSMNLQNSGERRTGMSDEQYTAAVDTGAYANFVNDGLGYGLAQWTSSGRKQALLDFARMRGTSIGDVSTQVEFMTFEMQQNPDLWGSLAMAQDVKGASDAFMTKYERPKNQSSSAKNFRASLGSQYAGLSSGVAVALPQTDGIQMTFGATTSDLAFQAGFDSATGLPVASVQPTVPDASVMSVAMLGASVPETPTMPQQTPIAPPPVVPSVTDIYADATQSATPPASQADIDAMLQSDQVSAPEPQTVTVNVPIEGVTDTVEVPVPTDDEITQDRVNKCNDVLPDFTDSVSDDINVTFDIP